jgi:hydroxymethylbilane synthase
MVHQIIRIGTRGSKLALFQSTMVKETLEGHNQNLSVELVEIKTSGDWTPAMGETKLSARDGGKGLFCKEIEQALLDKRIDIGVHSLKDMPAFLPAGLAMDHYLPREDARDVFVSARYASIDDLPQGAVIGTSSVRRQSFLLNKRPDLKIVPFRGNVPTRLEKIANNQVDATFLAYAGLKRLGLHQDKFQILELDEMLPACGQGIVAVECRAGDKDVVRALDSLQCVPTSIVAASERSLLATLDGSCRTPIGGYAEINGAVLSLQAQIGAEDGSQIWAEQGTTNDISVKGAAALGQSLGLKLKSQIPSDLLLEEYECG